MILIFIYSLAASLLTGGPYPIARQDIQSPFFSSNMSSYSRTRMRQRRHEKATFQLTLQLLTPAALGPFIRPDHCCGVRRKTAGAEETRSDVLLRSAPRRSRPPLAEALGNRFVVDVSRRFGLDWCWGRGSATL